MGLFKKRRKSNPADDGEATATDDAEDFESFDFGTLSGNGVPATVIESTPSEETAVPPIPDATAPVDVETAALPGSEGAVPSPPTTGPEATSEWNEFMTVPTDESAGDAAPLEAVLPPLEAVLPPLEPPPEPSSDGVPTGPEARVLLEILGLDETASWSDVREAHDALVSGHDPDAEADPERAALARAIRREMNSAYAALRLLRVP